ncbi:MAG: toprim domain-containing protein, partial [Candidatus Thiodiazotropha sp.]
MNDFISQFEAAIQNAGIEPPANIVADGELHRFPTNGRPSDTAGYYVLYPDGIPAGHFGCWRNGISQDWMADVGRKPSEVEKQAHRKRMVAMQATRAEEKRRRNDEARQTAKGKLQAAKPETGLHKYLELKGVGPHGLKSDGFNLLVPMRDSEGVLHSHQSISPDGSKKFLSGGRVKGMYYGIGQPNGVLCIAEGFATGASIHEATGHAVAVAFNSENLKPVAQALREKFPDLKLIVCADDDSKTEGNPGIT